MLMRDNLIRLYFLNKGTFEGIANTNFMVNNTMDENDLYEILGYSSSLGELTPSQVYEQRKDFVLNSYNPNYKKSLMYKFNVSNNSELIDVLMSKGILGLERRHVSTLGEFKNCGVPSKFINQKISHALCLLESKLNNSKYNGYSLIEFRKNLLLTSPSDALSTIKSYNINLDRLFKVRFYSENTASIKDNVLYISKIEGYTEDEVREILFNCYLLGLPKLPLYLRKVFLSSLPGTISMFDLDSIHNLIDISNICGCSVKSLLNSFGFNIPDAEEMLSKYSCYFSLYNNRIFFSNESSDLFYECSIDEFINLVSTNSIQSFDINLELALKDSELGRGSKEPSGKPSSNGNPSKPSNGSSSSGNMSNSNVFNS